MVNAKSRCVRFRRRAGLSVQPDLAPRTHTEAKRSHGDLSLPVAEYTAGNNLDSSRAFPRFRNGGNTVLHATMVDGSVKGFKIGEVTYGNIVANK